MKAGKQTTLGARATVSGIGVHSGLPVSLTLHPADAGSGITFVRLDEHVVAIVGAQALEQLLGLPVGGL